MVGGQAVGDARTAVVAPSRSFAPIARPVTAIVPIEKLPNTANIVHVSGPAHCIAAIAVSSKCPSTARSITKTSVCNSELATAGAASANTVRALIGSAFAATGAVTGAIC